MPEQQWLAERFEENRSHLRAVAYRMLGSLAEADDAVQESWMRLSRTGADGIGNLGGWLTTVVAHVCLDMLRSRASRREESLGAQLPEPPARGDEANPEQEALLADSVGLAVLVVLDRLAPAERLAFVLHDMFAVPFDEIAPIVGRSVDAARQLASRARRRVRGAEVLPDAGLAEQRQVVGSFLAAVRAGDFDAMVAVLDPEVVVRIDQAAMAPGGPAEFRGAQNWARQALAYAKGARFVELALVNGNVGALLAPRGRLARALLCTVENGKIVRIELVADPERLRQLDLAVLH